MPDFTKPFTEWTDQELVSYACQDPGKIMMLLMERTGITETVITGTEVRAFLEKHGTTHGLAIDAVSELEQGRVTLKILSPDQIPAFVQGIQSVQTAKTAVKH